MAEWRIRTPKETGELIQNLCKYIESLDKKKEEPNPAEELFTALMGIAIVYTLLFFLVMHSFRLL
jgi:hypothetical protein